MYLTQTHINELKKLCQLNQVKSLYAFGSVTRDDFSEDSDIDLVVDFDESDPYKYTDLYFNLKDKLEKFLKKKVDLIEERGIKNRFFKQELNKTKVLIYESQNKNLVA